MGDPSRGTRMRRHLPVLWLFPVFLLSLLAIGLLGTRVLSGSGEPNASAAVPSATPAAGQPERTTIAATSTPATPDSTATVAPHAAVVTQASTLLTQGAGPATRRVVLGYYVPYDVTSWASFEAEANALDYVDAQWVTVDACGSVGSRDDRTLIAYADEHGVKALPSLLTSSGWLNHLLLTDRTTTDHFLSQIVSYVVESGYIGIDLDLEGIDAEDRDAYSAFIARAADALHQRGKILTLAIPAKTSDVRTGWGGPYDYAALGRAADLILLMTYDYSWSSGPPGSIAPQEWVNKVASYAASQMPAEKILIGLAFYGYDWNTTLGGKARALLYSQAAALARQHGTQIATDVASRSGSFSYTARAGDTVPPPPSLPAIHHDITVRTPGQCLVAPAPGPTSPPAPAPRPSPTPVPIQDHVVWLEDATSVAGRLQIAVQHSLGGVGAWRLGQEDPAVWKFLDAYRSGG
jgi:spore germination protein